MIRKSEVSISHCRMRRPPICASRNTPSTTCAGWARDRSSANMAGAFITTRKSCGNGHSTAAVTPLRTIQHDVANAESGKDYRCSDPIRNHRSGHADTVNQCRALSGMRQKVFRLDGIWCQTDNPKSVKLLLLSLPNGCYFMRPRGDICLTMSGFEAFSLSIHQSFADSEDSFRRRKTGSKGRIHDQNIECCQFGKAAKHSNVMRFLCWPSIVLHLIAAILVP